MKKYYATVETKQLTVITLTITAKTKKEANEKLKKKYVYKKVISLLTTPPAPQGKRIEISKEDINDKIMYTNRSSRVRLIH